MISNDDYDQILASYQSCLPHPIPTPLTRAPVSSTVLTASKKTTITSPTETTLSLVTKARAPTGTTTSSPALPTSGQSNIPTVGPSHGPLRSEQRPSTQVTACRRHPYPRPSQFKRSRSINSPNSLTTSISDPSRSSVNFPTFPRLPSKPITPVPHPTLLILQERERHERYEQQKRRWLRKQGQQKCNNSSRPSMTSSTNCKIPEHLEALFKLTQPPVYDPRSRRPLWGTR